MNFLSQISGYDISQINLIISLQRVFIKEEASNIGLIALIGVTYFEKVGLEKAHF